MTSLEDERKLLIRLQTEVWDSIDNLCMSLKRKEWDITTDCPGWSVKDCISHLIGIEHRLLGRQVTDHVPKNMKHVNNDLGLRNEIDVDLRRTCSINTILEEFREVTSERKKILHRQQDFSEKAESPIGTGSIADLLSIRIFDCWVHEQDIRRAIRKPGNLSGNAAAHSFRRIDRTMPYIVGKKSKVGEGKSVEFIRTGYTANNFVVAVESGRARVTEGDVSPTVSLSMECEDYLILTCGREHPSNLINSGRISISGDAHLGQSIVRQMNFMI